MKPAKKPKVPGLRAALSMYERTDRDRREDLAGAERIIKRAKSAVKSAVKRGKK